MSARRLSVSVLLLACLCAPGARGDLLMKRLADARIALEGAERLAFSPGTDILLATAPRLREIHLHRVDWQNSAVSAIDAFPPTDALLGIPVPGRPTAVTVHPSHPMALALSQPRDARARGELMMLDLRARAPGRLLRSQLAGFAPAHLAVTPDGIWAVVANSGVGSRRTAGSIGLYDLRNLTGWEEHRLQEVPYAELEGLDRLLDRPRGRIEPYFVAIEPRGRLGAVALRGNDAVAWVDFRPAVPVLAGALTLPRGSEPTSVSLLNEPDGSLILAVAERRAQRVSFHRVELDGPVPNASLLARIEIPPLVHGGRPRAKRDPDTVVLRRVGGRIFAWVACAESNRVLMLDATMPSKPALIHRLAVAAPPRDLLPLPTSAGFRLLTGNGDGTVTIVGVDTAPAN
jgi:hypothetical protein